MFIKDIPLAGLTEIGGITGQDLDAAYKKLENLKKALREIFRKVLDLALLVQTKSESKKIPAEVVGHIVLVGQDNKKRFD